MTHEILNFKSENEDIPFYRLSFFILYHYYITILAGMQMSMMNIFFCRFSERLARREVDLPFGLVKCSGRPEQ